MFTIGCRRPDLIILLSGFCSMTCERQALLDGVHRHSFQHTRLVINSYNNLWRPILRLAEICGLKAPTLMQNWLSSGDIINLLHLSGWELIKVDHRILWPVKTPMLSSLFNKWLAPFLKHFCLTSFFVARPRPLPSGPRIIAVPW